MTIQTMIPVVNCPSHLPVVLTKENDFHILKFRKPTKILKSTKFMKKYENF